MAGVTVTGCALTEALAKIPAVAQRLSSRWANCRVPRLKNCSVASKMRLGTLEAQVAQQRSRDAQQSITDVFEAARRIRACEWAAMNSEPEAVRAGLRQETELYSWPASSAGRRVRIRRSRRC